MKILGIDPGTQFFGYALIEGNSNPMLITSGTLDLSKINDHYTKLSKILDFVKDLISQFEPQVLSIESQFFSKNIQAMFKLGRIQGVCIAAAISSNMNVFEYSPREIKQSITGNGNASKEQIAKMITYLLLINNNFEKYDEADAIAIALTHYFKNKTISSENKYGSWSDFISKNSNKIKK